MTEGGGDKSVKEKDGRGVDGREYDMKRYGNYGMGKFVRISE